MKYIIPFALIFVTGCSAIQTQSAVTKAYKAEATADAAVTTAMSAWGAYVKTENPPASEQVTVEKAFNDYQKAELAAIDATVAFANASGTNSVTAQQNESTALTSAASSLSELLTVSAQFESSTNK